MQKNKSFLFKLSSNSLTSQRGITLIELMVAMAVSSVIMLGVSNIYFSSKKSYVIHDEFARLQENSRYAFDVLASDIRHAGYKGCAAGNSEETIENDLNDTNNATWDFATGVMGYEAAGTDINNADKGVTAYVAAGSSNTGLWSTAKDLQTSDGNISENPDATIANLAVAGSDILVLTTTEGTGVLLTDSNNGSANFEAEDIGGTNKLDSNGCINGFCDDDIVMVSDCTKAIIFQITNVSTGGGPGTFKIVHSKKNSIDPGNKSAAWKGEYDFEEGSELMRLITKTYFVGVPNTDASKKDFHPSLYVRENGGDPIPLIQGVENMQILYGVDETGDGAVNRFYSADDVPNVDENNLTTFDGVVSIRISLLVRTPEPLPGVSRSQTAANAINYQLISPLENSSITIDPIAENDTSDRHMRKVYTFTVARRN